MWWLSETKQSCGINLGDDAMMEKGRLDREWLGGSGNLCDRRPASLMN